jgi:hypothetical protein
MWMWGHEAGSHNAGWGLSEPSRMTPLEGACYLGVPNLILIRYEDKPEMPFDQYAIPFRALKQVYWSVTGAAGATSEQERDHVLGLAERFPNIVGLFLDDFFCKRGDARPAVMSLDQVRAMKREMNVAGRQLRLGVTFYDHDLDRPELIPFLELCDEVGLFTWEAPNLRSLEANFGQLERIAPRSDKLLNLYLWDYGRKRPMPPDLMELQANTGLRWLVEGRIAGMIFLASCICDLGLETVEWTRNWIAQVADTALAR